MSDDSLTTQCSSEFKLGSSRGVGKLKYGICDYVGRF